MHTSQEMTITDQWQTQILARILKKHQVLFVTRPELKKTLQEMKMGYAETVEEAISIARGLFNSDASVTVIPNGVSLVVEG